MTEQKKRKSKSVSRSLICGSIIFIVLLCFVTGAGSFHIFKNELLKSCEQYIQDELEFTLAVTDGDDLAECIETGKASDKYNDLVFYLDNIRQTSSLDYISIITVKEDEETVRIFHVASGLYPDEREDSARKDMNIPGLGTDITEMYPAEFGGRILMEMLTADTPEFHMSDTEFGHLYDGVVQITDSDDNPVALLTAGVSLDGIYGKYKNYVYSISVGAVTISILFIIFVFIWLEKRILFPFRMIEKNIESFAVNNKSQYDPDTFAMTRPDIKTDDELGAMADSLVKMSENMRKYVKDIIASDMKAEEMQMAITKASENANKDPLTGIRNRIAYNTEKGRIEEHLKEGYGRFGIAVVDFDNLKKINNVHGHNKGDVAIQELCELVCSIFRHSPVFRTGGDEFVVILENRDYTDIDALINQFEHIIRNRSQKNEDKPWESISASIGYALFDPDTDASVDDVMGRAEKYMYHNKLEKLNKTDNKL